MSAIRCNELGLAYDPSIRLYMQLANGNCNLSLGLACNVPFLIESLTFYLQVHIVQSPAYDIFSEQPFHPHRERYLQFLLMKIRPLLSMIPTQDRRLQSLPFPDQPEALPKHMSQGNWIFNSRRGDWRQRNPWNSHTNSCLQITTIYWPVSPSVHSHQYPFFYYSSYSYSLSNVFSYHFPFSISQLF